MAWSLAWHGNINVYRHIHIFICLPIHFLFAHLHNFGGHKNLLICQMCIMIQNSFRIDFTLLSRFFFENINFNDFHKARLRRLNGISFSFLSTPINLVLVLNQSFSFLLVFYFLYLWGFFFIFLLLQKCAPKCGLLW